MVKNIIPETLALVTEKYEYSTDTHTTVQRNTRKPTNYNVGDEDAAHRRQFVVRSGSQEHYAMSSVCVCVCVRARHAVRYVCVCVCVRVRCTVLLVGERKVLVCSGATGKIVCIRVRVTCMYETVLFPVSVRSFVHQQLM